MNKLLIITGGSRGIGEKTIMNFLQNGWDVINIARSSSKIDSVVNFNIDLSDSRNIVMFKDKLHQAVAQKRIISLVHNAAFCQKDSMSSLKLDILQLTLEVNLISCVLLNQVFLPFMLPGSSIVYIGSTLAEIAVPNSASYVILKHALKGLMQSTCHDLSEKLIHTCCINPGLVDTMLLKSTMSKESVDNILLETNVMGKRLIEPNEIAKIIYFSANTPTINGATINANLGQISL